MSFLGEKNKSQPTLDSTPRAVAPGRPTSSPIESTIGPNTMSRVTSREMAACASTVSSRGRSK